MVTARRGQLHSRLSSVSHDSSLLMKFFNNKSQVMHRATLRLIFEPESQIENPFNRSGSSGCHKRSTKACQLTVLLSSDSPCPKTAVKSTFCSNCTNLLYFGTAPSCCSNWLNDVGCAINITGENRSTSVAHRAATRSGEREKKIEKTAIACAIFRSLRELAALSCSENESRDSLL